MKQERTVTEVQENLLEGQIKAFKKQMDNMYDLNLRLMQWIDDCRMFLAENGILREFEQNYGTYEARIEAPYMEQNQMQKEMKDSSEEPDKGKRENKKDETAPENSRQKQESMKKSSKILRI
jgi:hypothetical protein